MYVLSIDSQVSRCHLEEIHLQTTASVRGGATHLLVAGLPDLLDGMTLLLHTKLVIVDIGDDLLLELMTHRQIQPPLQEDMMRLLKNYQRQSQTS
jgi:hypothetical protein